MPTSFVAQAGSFCVCPVCDPKPHVGGPVAIAGRRTVLVGGLPAAAVGDLCLCVGPPPNKLKSGSSSVEFDGQPVCRIGDPTTHGGAVLTGCSTVLIG